MIIEIYCDLGFVIHYVIDTQKNWERNKKNVQNIVLDFFIFIYNVIVEL